MLTLVFQQEILLVMSQQFELVDGVNEHGFARRDDIMFAIPKDMATINESYPFLDKRMVFLHEQFDSSNKQMVALEELTRAHYEDHKEDAAKIEQKFEKIEQKVEKIEQQLEKIEQKFEQNFEKFEQKFDKKFESLESKMISFGFWSLLLLSAILMARS